MILHTPTCSAKQPALNPSGIGLRCQGQTQPLNNFKRRFTIHFINFNVHCYGKHTILNPAPLQASPKLSQVLEVAKTLEQWLTN